MVSPKIGISDRNLGGSYDEVDFLDNTPTPPPPTQQRFASQRQAAAAADTHQYTIDSDEESTDDGSSDEDGEYAIDDDEESSSEDDDLSEDDDEENITNGEVNSVAATEVMGNLVKNPRAQQHYSPAGSRVPPANSFRNSGRRLPSYIGKGGKRPPVGKDELGKHQRLSTIDQDDDEDDDDGDEESNTKQVLVEKSGNKRDQFNDNNYDAQNSSIKNQDFGSYSYSTSYSSADPSNVNYEARSLRRMPVDLSNGTEEKKRKIVFFGFLTAMFICFLIGLISIISHAARHHVMSAPPNLENICDIANISTKQGHEYCESLCEEAKCCMAPGVNSCFEGQEEVCRMYAPCAALYSTNRDSDMHVMVPPAPVNLPQLCSTESIMYVSGYIECNAACEAGYCCTVPDLSGSSLATAGLVDLSKTPTSCVNTHPELCDGYSPCDALRAVKDVHGTPSDLVNSKCTPNKMQSEVGIDECENACQSRACCFAESDKKNCYNDNMLWCDQFDACKILTDKNYKPSDDLNDDDNSGQSVTERCKKEHNDLSEQELSMCKMICEPVSCCFYEDIGCNREIDCDFYNFCSNFMTSDLGYVDIDVGAEDEDIQEILPPGGGQHTPGPSIDDVEKACEGINSRHLLTLHPFHQMHCGQLCSNYMCCFGDDYDPASCHEQTTCDKYTACKVMIGEKDKSPGNSDEDKSPGNAVDLCSVDNLLKPGGFTQCEEYCSDHMCCFEPSGCANNKQHQCQKNEACRILSTGVLLGTDIHGYADFDYTYTCSKEVVYGDSSVKNVCSAICEQHKCCWDDGIGCIVGHDCAKYKVCDVLKEDDNDSEDEGGDDEDEDYGDDGSSLEALKGVCKKELVVSHDNFFANNCIEECDDAKGCYNGSFDYKSDFCAERTACASVSKPSLACSGLGNGNGEAACKNACEIFSCCWNEHGCYSTHEAECLVALQHCNYSS